MSVIPKVDQKVKSVIDKLPEGYSEDDFLELFKKEYQEDYEKCWKVFLKEERDTKPGKHHPMQHPDKHIKNALKSYLSRNEHKQKGNNGIMKHLCAILFVFIAATANASDFEVDGIYYNILSEDDRMVEVASAERDANIYVPRTVTNDSKTYLVTAIGNKAFTDSGVKSIDMRYVTTIGDEAFYDCGALTSVSMPSVTTIGDSAFYLCRSLSSVSMPSATTIGNKAFYLCRSLSSVEMPSVKTIGDEVFCLCDALTSISIPQSCTSIGLNPFAGCTALKEIVVDENNPNYSSVDGVLYDKDKTTIISWPTAEGNIVIPQSVTKISSWALIQCFSLRSVDMSSVKTIGDEAFYNCVSLSSVEMPEVLTIGGGAFNLCSALTSVSMPMATTIGDNAFDFCDNLTSVEMPEVTTIGNSAFRDCNYLKSVEMPEVTTIGNSAFYNCLRLSSVKMPSVKTIGDMAFYDCSLKTDSMPSVTTIGNSAFCYCGALSSVYMPSVKTIGEKAFYNCLGLSSVYMPSVKTIGDEVFYLCETLESVDMSDVSTIGEYAFYDCKSLSSVNIPISATTIGKGAFSLCYSLASVYCHWEEPLECDPLFTDEIFMNATLYVPTGTVDAYRSVYPWSEFINIEERDYSGIADATASEVVIKVIDGAITVEGGVGMASAPVVEVYSTGGLCIYRGTDSSIGGLPRGVYVVKVGNTVQKVAL